jgi:alcohol dehydrogenase class IV
MSRFIIEHVPANPTIEYANSVVVPVGTTEIISRGGGSTIDVGKWVAKRYDLKHTAIPTTGGTGSEATKYVVLTVDGKKKTFIDERYIPDSSILDPNLLVTLPREHTIGSGLDALSQSLEVIWSTKANLESISYATAAMELVIKSLYKCVKDPEDTKARMDMLIAANLSGRAINITPTNVCHAVSYPLTDIYGIPHGIACGMSLSYFAEKAGFEIKSFVKPLLPQYKFSRKKIAKEAINNPKLLDYPYEVTEMDIMRALT